MPLKVSIETNNCPRVNPALHPDVQCTVAASSDASEPEQM